MTPEEPSTPRQNRLAAESSPYLQQHASNPVDWYPWCDAAFDRARELDRPIFLSVGYSTCHWCHVMEHESFEDEEVAQLLNDNFVSIKVDREERPDIDSTYMIATQLVTQHGGWPNSLWLTPDARPWYAGTYFPPQDRGGRPGFKTVLRQLAESWESRREEIEEQATHLAETMRQVAHNASSEKRATLDQQLIDNAVVELRKSFDSSEGGFGGAPKFPPHGSLRLLLWEYRRTQEASLLQLIQQTLDAMAAGGIHDHVGGGFHRYSTDAEWLLPHFEKMLYDNAQLLRCYAEAFELTGETRYAWVARRTIDWLRREMLHPAGGFYSAYDADSEGEEGKFYVWTRAEILQVLGHERGEPFCEAYGIVEDGNFRDEATGAKTGANIPHLQRDPIPAQLSGELDDELVELRKSRDQRIWPHRDDKILTGWNGLVIAALAYAGRVFEDESMLTLARGAADFLIDTVVDGRHCQRCVRQGEVRISGYLDDYAYLADGLLELAQSSGDQRYATVARRLTDTLHQEFHDDTGGFFSSSTQHEELLFRSKDAYDQAIPSANGVVVQVLLRQEPNSREARDAAFAVLSEFSGLMSRAPRGTESLLLGLAHYLAGQEPAGRLTCDARVQRDNVELRLYASHLQVQPQQRVGLFVELLPAAGWTINAGEDPRRPSGVKMELRSGVVVSTEWKRLEKGGWGARLEVEVVGAERLQLLGLQVEWEACTEGRCVPPERATVHVPIAVMAESGVERYRELWGGN